MACVRLSVRITKGNVTPGCDSAGPYLKPILIAYIFPVGSRNTPVLSALSGATPLTGARFLRAVTRAGPGAIVLATPSQREPQHHACFYRRRAPPQARMEVCLMGNHHHLCGTHTQCRAPLYPTMEFKLKECVDITNRRAVCARRVAVHQSAPHL